MSILISDNNNDLNIAIDIHGNQMRVKWQSYIQSKQSKKKSTNQS